MTENPLPFPRPGFGAPAGYQDGMTLRDWFAGQAMVAFIISSKMNGQDTAETAYAFADSMLEERSE